LTIFELKGLPGNRRERIENAIIAGGKHLAEPYEGWIIADPFRRAIKVVITGAHGFQREIIFAPDEEQAVITDRVRGTFED
jgi:hypothetical protein